MLQTNDITDRIREWITGHFPLARERDISPSDSLIESGIIDSLGTLDLVMFLEEEFGFTVGDEDMVADHFETIESISRFVSSKTGS